MSVFVNTQHEEEQYLNIIREIINTGTWENGRNGKTKAIFGTYMKFSLKDGNIPSICLDYNRLTLDMTYPYLLKKLSSTPSISNL